MPPSGPYTLVTVNNAPERAKRLIGRMVEDVKDLYTIIHAGNADDIDKVGALVEEVRPDLLFTASMWTPEQSRAAHDTARIIIPDVKTFAIPQGLHNEGGPDAVVEYIKAHLPELLDDTSSIDAAKAGMSV